MTAIRLALVDDHPTLLKGIAALFAEDDRFEIVGTGKSADDALALAAGSAPTVLILDLSMPGDVFSAIQAVCQLPGPVKIVVFTAFADIDLAIRALDAGAHAFVLKGSPSDDLYEAINAVLAGEVFVSPDFAPKLMGAFQHRSRRESVMQKARLSVRELQLVDCLFEGMTNKEIARTLQLSEKTIKHYMTNLMNKLKVKSRLEVVLFAQDLRRAPDGPGSNG